MTAQFFGYIGRKAFRLKDAFEGLFKEISGVYYLTRHTLYCSFIEPLRGKPVKWGSMWVQMEEVGVKSALIVFLTLFLIGVILAIQTAYQMSQFGALEYVGALVGVAITRELGPLMAALVMAGRVGAAFTAELGTMKVSDEILALETMALDPVKFLIAPRFLALIVMLPCLTILGNLMGIFGGFLIGVTTLGIDPVIYMDRSIEAIQVKDVFSGLFKSGMFALIIVMIGSYLAFVIEGGAEKVGQNTRSAVVTSMILIIIADMVFTAFFFFLE